VGDLVAVGADHIVQSFMTVVVGGIGKVRGTLAMQTCMTLLIQFRPRGSSPSAVAQREIDPTAKITSLGIRHLPTPSRGEGGSALSTAAP
jgi:branched-subunit amino acid ABC-type transport system permease component